jgi:Fe-S cluster assembly iron-binding protein IscA
MLTVTDNALDHLSEALSVSEKAGENDCFRFVVANDNTLSLAYQSPQVDDQTFSHQGTQVLAVPASLSEVLSERELDVDDKGHLVFLPKSV